MEIEELSAAKILRENKFGAPGTLVWSFHAKESAQKIVKMLVMLSSNKI